MDITNQYWPSMNTEQETWTEYKLSMAVHKNVIFIACVQCVQQSQQMYRHTCETKITHTKQDTNNDQVMVFL